MLRKMKITVFIPTASVEVDKPTVWYQQLLDAGVKYYQEHSNDQVNFVISGRWNNVIDHFLITEAEVGQNYILTKIPKVQILKEDLAVETGGNFAFSKPFIDFLAPDLVVIVNSKAKEERSKYFAKKIFGQKYQYEFLMVEDTFSENPRAMAKEPKAIGMFKRLFDNIEDGDDKTAREILLYKTPFYYRGMMDDKKFFHEYWDGGFVDFKEKRLSIDNK